MNSPRQLPDPWFPDTHLEVSRQAAATVVAGLIVGANNDAHYLPVVFPCDCTIYSLKFAGTNTSGNYDIGFYDASYNRIASKGSTAMSAAVQTLTFTNDIRVIGGDLYYAAFSFSSSAAQIVRAAFAVTGLQRSAGYGLQATAHPLPNPGVPASPAATSVAPIFCFGVR